MKTFPLPPFPRSPLPCTSRDAPCLCQGWRSLPARQCSTLHEIQPAIPCRAESMRPSWTKKTDRLTHSSALAGRGTTLIQAPRRPIHSVKNTRAGCCRVLRSVGSGSACTSPPARPTHISDKTSPLIEIVRGSAIPAPPHYPFRT
jgi:hypothetical protein